jgi:hypothetical protein
MVINTYLINGQPTPMAEGDLREYLEQYGIVLRRNGSHCFTIVPLDTTRDEIDDYYKGGFTYPQLRVYLELDYRYGLCVVEDIRPKPNGTIYKSVDDLAEAIRLFLTCQEVEV